MVDDLSMLSLCEGQIKCQGFMLKVLLSKCIFRLP